MLDGAIGRQIERDAILEELHQVSTSRDRVPTIFHFHGPASIGKTTLIRNAPQWVTQQHFPGIVQIDLHDPWSFDPVLKLMDVRNQVRAKPFGYTTDGFDYAFLLYDLAYRGGSLSGPHLKDSKFSPGKIVHDSVQDALKSGTTELIKDIQKSGVWGILTAGVTGVQLTSSIALAAQAALISGLAISSVQLITVILNAARQIAHKRRLFRDNEALAVLFSKEALPTADAFLDALPRILAKDILVSSKVMMHPSLCITLDPAEELAADSDKYAGRVLSRRLFPLFTSLQNILVVSSSRTSPDAWKRRVLPEPESRSVKFHAHLLGKLRAGQVLLDLVELGVPSEAPEYRYLENLAPNDMLDPASVFLILSEFAAGRPA